MFRPRTHKPGRTARRHGALFVTLGLVAGVTAIAVDAASHSTSASVDAAGSVIEDNLDSNDYSGGTPVGADSWSGPWTETNDAGTPDFSTGFITANTGALRLTDLDNNSRSVQRAVDLSAFDVGATLSFTVRSRAGNEGLNVQFRTGDNAGDFAQLTQFPFTNTVPPVDTRYTFVLEADMIRQNGELRFSGFDGWEGDDAWVIDDIAIDTPVSNPDLANSCGTELTVILDESGSIQNPGNAVTLVEDAVDALAEGLVDTGSTLRIVEFSTDARDAQIPAGTATAQDVNQAYVDGALTAYLTTPNTVGAGLPTDYEPNNAPGLTQTFTNWEAGLFRAGSVAPNNVAVTPLVFFVTDGDPNTIGTNNNSATANLGGTGEPFNVAAAAASYQEAAALKQAGAHVVGVGVGRAATNAPSFARLTEIVESQNPEIWTNQPGEDLNIQTVDAIQVNTFEALAEALRQAVSELCSQSLDITKVDDEGNAVVGRAFTTNVTGTPGAAAFEFIDPDAPAQSATVVTDGVGDASFQWSSVGFVQDPNAWTSTATFTEQLPPGWTLPDVPGTCTVSPGGADVPLSAIVNETALATFTVDHTFRAGETVSCEVVNKRPGTIEVKKVTDPATTELFTFTPGGWNNNETFELTDGGTFTSGDLAVGGAYAVDETDLPDGWTLLPDAICTTPGEPDSQITDILVASNKVTTCTFNNREAATLTIEKQTLPDNDPTQFTFTPGGWNSDQTFTLADGESQVSDDLSPGTYSIAEAVPDGWDLTGVSCTDAEPNTPGTQVVLAADDDVTCVFTNTKKGVLTLEKVLVDADQPVSTGANSFEVSYNLAVNNPGPGDNTYTLTDSPIFGDGTTITSLTATGPDGDVVVADPTAGVYTLATNVDIAADTTDTYQVTVAFSVAADMTPAERACTDGAITNGQGTFNSATITFTGGTSTDTACADIPPSLTLEKVLVDADQPVSTGANSFEVSYNLAVNNPGPGDNTYTLTDSPIFGDGTTITSLTATGPDGDVVVADPTAGVYTLATNVDIAADTTDTYQVTVAFSVAADMTPAERACTDGAITNGQGTFNSATITFTGGTSTDTACADIPDPDVTITKTVSSEPIPNGDGTSTVEYTVDVVNALDAGPGLYDLTDSPQFSQGVVVESKSVSNALPGTITTDPSFDTTGQVVTGEAIASNTTHRYVVSVTVSTTFTPELLYVECEPGVGAPGTGLYNQATITVNGVTTPADDCTDLPGDLTVDKDDGGVTVIAGGAPFSYTLTVTNIGGLSTGEPVTVTDELPAEFAWVRFPGVGGTLPFCEQAGQTLTCTVDPTLVDRGGRTTSFEVTAQALGGTAPSELGYQNLSYVNSPEDPAPDVAICPVDDAADLQADALRFLADPGQFLQAELLGGDPSNNVACDRTPVIDGEIEVNKTDDVVDGDKVVSDQEFTYTLNVANVGSSPLDSVTLADDLPESLELVSVDAGAGWTCNDVDPIACGFAGILAAGDTTTDVVLTVRVSDPFDGPQIDNTVTSTAIVRTETDSKSVTATDTEVTPVSVSADLQIVKTASADIVDQGQPVSFELVVTNNGPDTATEVVVSDILPSQLALTGASSTDFTCSIAGNAVTCARPELAVGASGTITVQAIVNSGVVGTVPNTATVTGRQPDPDPSNNTSTDTINVPEVDVDPPVPPTIPITGSNVNSMVAIALAMVMAGFALMLTTNKRRRQPAWPKPDTTN